MSRFDRFRSLVRGGADRARNAIMGDGLRELIDTVKNVGRGRIPLPDAALTAASARAPGVDMTTVVARDGAFRVAASYEDGTDLAIEVRIAAIQFAPGGAKEVTFAVTPAEALRDGRASDQVSAIACALVDALWTAALAAGGRPASTAILDRDGPGRLRIDLRTVDSVRELTQGQSPMAMVMDAIGLERVDIGVDGAELVLALPTIGT